MAIAYPYDKRHDCCIGCTVFLTSGCRPDTVGLPEKRLHTECKAWRRCGGLAAVWRQECVIKFRTVWCDAGLSYTNTKQNMFQTTSIPDVSICHPSATRINTCTFPGFTPVKQERLHVAACAGQSFQMNNLKTPMFASVNIH